MNRKCLVCGYEGNMKTWLRNYNFPQFLALFLLLFYLIPGLLFIAWGWKKYKCPKCGTLDKNTPVESMRMVVPDDNQINKEKVHLTDHQHVALSNASFDLPIYAENPSYKYAQMPKGAPCFNLRTIESLERHGYLENNGKGGYLLTPEGKEALLDNLKN